MNTNTESQKMKFKDSTVKDGESHEHSSSRAEERQKEVVLKRLNDVLSIKAQQIRHRITAEMEDIESEVDIESEAVMLQEVQAKAIQHEPVAKTLIPVSKARQRRRQEQRDGNTKAMNKAGSKEPKSLSTVNIKKYRPDYTWNRGGRVKELRIRFLARKFLFIWKTRTFGRVPLSTAQEHYEKVLKQKSFTAWHTYWWIIVKEWRLGVRAECHLRHKIGLKVFTEWRKYTLLRNVAKAKKGKALRHYSDHLLGKALECWKDYIHKKRSQAKLLSAASEFKDRSTIRFAWQKWRKECSIRESQKESESFALQFWAYRLQAQHWLAWKNAMVGRIHEEERYANARIFYHNNVLTKCLKAWKMYNDNRNVKKAHTAFAQRLYRSRLKGRFLKHWYHRWHLRHSIQLYQDEMEIMATKFRLKWAVWRWHAFITLRRSKKEKHLMAERHYTMQLKRVGFDSFHLNIVHARIKVMRTHLSSQLCVIQLQRRMWSHWIKAFDQKQEEKLMPMTETALEHYRHSLLQKCFYAVVDYCEKRKHKKAQLAMADAHFYLHSMPNSLFQWRIFVELEKSCRELAFKAEEFRRFNVLQKVFSTWQSSANHVKDERMMHHMAVLHHESVLGQRLFQLWRRRMAEAEEEREKTSQALQHYLHSLCQNVFTGWTSFIQMKQLSAINNVKAIRHCYLHQTGTCLRHWKEWLSQKKEKATKIQKAEKHRRERTLGRCVLAWMSVWQEGKTFQASAQAHRVHVMKKLLRVAFAEWKRITREEALERRRNKMATNFHQKTLSHKALQEWREWAAVRSYKRSQTSQMVAAAVIQLQKVKQTIYLRHWKSEYERSRADCQLMKKASTHHSFRVLSRMMQSWRAFHSTCLQKKLLSRQCKWFHDVRLTAKFYLTWKERLKEKREEDEKTQLALWQWSLVLQRKVLLAWSSFKEMQTRKKDRLHNARSFHRHHMLREASAQWLATADSLSQVRAATAARQHTKAVVDCFTLVQNCALRWRAWTQKQVAARKDSSRTGSSTFPSSISKKRFSTISHQLPIASNVLPVMTVRATSTNEPPRPKQATFSPSRDVFKETQSKQNYSFVKPRRPPPTRPSFLVDSLKRAGLWSDLLLSPDKLAGLSEEEETISIPSLNELKLAVSPDYPETVRFTPQEITASLGVKKTLNLDVNLDIDSFSADIISGSSSSLGPCHQVINSLHLSNTDTDNDPSGTLTNSSQSHQMFTPSTQLSQFSGNPLLYSSPISDTNTARAATNRQVGEDSLDDLQGASATVVVSGNLDVNKRGLQSVENWQHQQHEYQQKQKDAGFASDGKEVDNQHAHQGSNFIFLKPQDFMSKPSVSEKTGDAVHNEPVHLTKKRTPRVFAKHTMEAATGQMPLSDLKGTLRHTPREVTSPRRSAPQGILHNKISDSDGDVSPLNTARSRGTVTFASPKSPTPEEEIVNIRDRLRYYNQQKQRLRALQKQYRQLSSWLGEQNEQREFKMADEVDEDSQGAMEELDMVRLEVAKLQVVVDSQKPTCERLVLRAQELAQGLQLPFSL